MNNWCTTLPYPKLQPVATIIIQRCKQITCIRMAQTSRMLCTHSYTQTGMAITPRFNETKKQFIQEYSNKKYTISNEVKNVFMPKNFWWYFFISIQGPF